MPVFKCKMCGGSLEVSEGMTVCECEYCGTKQTLPRDHSDAVTNNFNRANNLRMKSEFDRALELYEKIINLDPDEPEAYWGAVLCKYGIEYVEDPATLQKVPTCHRTQLESVLADVDYLSAIEHADPDQKRVLEAEAARIDALQKNILDIVGKEKPFDVFICYKETDEQGSRTQDSVIANDIYYQLTQEGFKVFYAAITLEDKLGQEYEPYIFAALQSSKVMLVIGTKPEYFNAVWVRNEWSRYLKMVKADRSKLLIPCYKDMDAYELPEEFSHLQAQNMGKIGFITDVIRGIKKVLRGGEAEKAPVAAAPAAAPAGADIKPLLKRASIFLDSGDFDSAKEYCNRALDIDPENSQAYYYMLLAEFKCRNKEEMSNLSIENGMKNNKVYINTYRFANDGIKSFLDNADKQSIYNYFMNKEKSAKTETEFAECVKGFEKIKGYKDADEKANAANKKMYIAAYELAESYFRKKSDMNAIKNAKEIYSRLGDYEDSKNKVKLCEMVAYSYLVDNYRKRKADINKSTLPDIISSGLLVIFGMVIVIIWRSFSFGVRERTVIVGMIGIMIMGVFGYLCIKFVYKRYHKIKKLKEKYNMN